MTITQDTASATAAALRHYFPEGATVSTIVLDTRRNRSGVTVAQIVVLATQDGTSRNVSGMVSYVMYTPSRSTDHATAYVSLLGHGLNPGSALVSELSRILYGSSTVLRHVSL